MIRSRSCKQKRGAFVVKSGEEGEEEFFLRSGTGT